ncbi:portal protein [Kiloniella antarctica]|uniref:Portal protein n=1 Tax=Kiloniella antarctica TaxID=1550907 RepID=A0ABW5BM45_9PROT
MSMDDAELQSAVKYEIQRAESYIQDDVNPERQKALKAYRADPYGDEVDGRSKIVATDVRDTVEAMMPELMRPYLAAGKIGEYQPQQQEDEEFCEQATDYVHHCFVNDNKGDEQLYVAFKDALMEKTGIFKAWWQQEEKTEEAEYQGLDEAQLMEVAADDEIKVLEQAQDHEGLWSIKIKRTWTDGRLATDVIPPDEFFVSPECRNDLDKANCVGQRRTATYSDLIAEGYPKAKLDDIPSGEDNGDDTNDVRHDNSFQGGDHDSDSPDPSRREITVYEAYLRMDYDQDGIAELRRVVCGGNAYTILENEAVDQHPYSLTSPSWQSHKVIGEAVADQMQDIQRLRTVLQRQMLDNLYLANSPMKEIDVDKIVNMDDVLNSRIGGIVRVKKGLGGVREIATPFTASATFPMLEYIDKMKEERTGISRNSQGLNPDILQNVTAAAVAQASAGSQSRLEMISRVLAWGIKSHFKKMLRVIVTHQDKPRTVRLRNKWVDVDPRYWNAEMDCSIDVGLGSGLRQEKLQTLGLILKEQKEAMQMLGMNNPIVGLDKIRHTLGKMINEAGFKNDEAFFGEVSEEILNQMKEQEGEKKPPPDPKMIEVQGKLQIEREKMQQEFVLRKEEMAMEFQLEREKMALGQASNGNINRNGF